MIWLSKLFGGASGTDDGKLQNLLKKLERSNQMKKLAYVLIAMVGLTCVTTVHAGLVAMETGYPSVPFVRPTTESVKSLGTWTSSWSAFVKQVALVVPGDSYAGSANAIFHGKKVSWTGKVSKIDPQKETGKSGSIEIIMTGEKLALEGSKTVQFANLRLSPEGGEWKTWSSVSVDDTVLFTTTLDKDKTYVLHFLTLLNQSGGPMEVISINTKGGTCQKIVAPGDKK